MPEYLSPGVYVEEVSSGAKPIEGVSTSTAGFVGPTERGPVTPRLVTSWLDYQRWFGSYPNRETYETPMTAYMPYGVDGFFTNGGQRLYVARVASSDAKAFFDLPTDLEDTFLRVEAIGPGLWGKNVLLKVDAASSSKDLFRITVLYYKNGVPFPFVDPTIAANRASPFYREPDVMEAFDNLTVTPGVENNVVATINRSSRLIVVSWMPKNDGGDVVPARPKNHALETLAENIVDLGEQRHIRLVSRVSGEWGNRVSFAVDSDQLTLTWNFSKGGSGNGYELANYSEPPYELKDKAGNPFSSEEVVREINQRSLLVHAAVTTDIALRKNGDLSGGEEMYRMEYTPQRVEAKGYVEVPEVEVVGGGPVVAERRRPPAKEVRAKAAKDEGGEAKDKEAGAEGEGESRESKPEPPASAPEPPAPPPPPRRSFAVTAGTPGVIELVADPTKSDESPESAVVAGPGGNLVSYKVGKSEDETVDQLELAWPLYPGSLKAGYTETYDVTGDAAVLATLVNDNSVLVSAAAAQDKSGTSEGRLAGGRYYEPNPTVDGFEGSEGPPATGLAGLAMIDGIALLAAPDSTNDDIPDANQVIDAMINQCEILRDRFAVVSTDAGKGGVQDIRPLRDTSYGATYYPWIRIYDSAVQKPLLIPAVGHTVGLYARNDNDKGVWHAPANEVLRGLYLSGDNPQAGPLEYQVNKGEQDVLNPRGVNVIRDFRNAGRGVRVWGARTMSSDPEWRYVNVRRLFIYVEQSIDEGTQWVVFEPNVETTWAGVVRSISGFLNQLWRSGGLQGQNAAEAYFVKCDRTTMTQDDIDNGRLICLVGIAPVKPAEFVIIRIGQKTLEAS